MKLPEMKQKLRVALIAGTLGQGGAEKQLVYMARALNEVGADVRVYCLTQDEFYEATLRMLKIPVVWVGQHANILRRLFELIRLLWEFQPRFVQSCHSYTNLYAAISARWVGAIDIGAVRSNVAYDFNSNGLWGWWLLHFPRWLLTNSYAAQKTLMRTKRSSNIFTLPNVIDLEEFERQSKTHLQDLPYHDGKFTVVTVGRLISVKRFDRLIRAMAAIGLSRPNVKTFIVGDGPERENLEKLAIQLGLTDSVLCFLGRRDDIPWILSQCDMFVLSSNDEGFPNVLLEAMAANLPIVTTPAGDCERIVQDGVTGFVVDFEDLDRMIDCIRLLAESSNLRKHLGDAGGNYVKLNYDIGNLPENLLTIYHQISPQSDINNLLSVYHESVKQQHT